MRVQSHVQSSCFHANRLIQTGHETVNQFTKSWNKCSISTVNKIFKLLLECPTITVLAAAFDVKVFNDTELLKSCLDGRNKIINFHSQTDQKATVKTFEKTHSLRCCTFHFCFSTSPHQCRSVTSSHQCRTFLLLPVQMGYGHRCSLWVWRRTNRQPCHPPLSNLSTSPRTTRPDGSGRWDNRIAAEHLPRYLGGIAADKRTCSNERTAVISHTQAKNVK